MDTWPFVLGTRTKVIRRKQDRDMQLEQQESHSGRIDTYILHRNTQFGKKGARFAIMVIKVPPASRPEFSPQSESYRRFDARQTAEDLVFRAWTARFGEMDWENLQVRIIHCTFEILVEYRVQS